VAGSLDFLLLLCIDSPDVCPPTICRGVEENQLTGTLPPEWSNMTNLTKLCVLTCVLAKIGHALDGVLEDGVPDAVLATVLCWAGGM
jgi:hypothetical protein